MKEKKKMKKDNTDDFLKMESVINERLLREMIIVFMQQFVFDTFLQEEKKGR